MFNFLAVKITLSQDEIVLDCLDFALLHSGAFPVKGHRKTSKNIKSCLKAEVGNL